MRIADRGEVFANLVFAVVLATLLHPCALAQNNANNYCVSSPRSAVLTARNGLNRAYVETTASQPRRMAGRIPETPCASRSELFVSTSKGVFDLAFMQSPTPERPGNGMNAIDWSPSAQYFLVDLITYQYEGEGAEHTPLIYDADSWLVYQPDLYRLFKEHFGRDCGANASIEGFTSDGLVLLKVVRLVSDPTFEPGTPPSCVNHRGFWSLDFKKGEVKFLGDRYEVKKYSQ
ncbi:MAG TPA: hypothetical protein VGN39_13365 [Terriglobales bacterium]|nr:hypothetical protein [Terriglobales bacterium]